MNGRAHLLMGAASAAPLVFVVPGTWSLAGCVGAAMVASVAPDIDQSKASMAINWPRQVGWMLTPATKRGGKRRPNFLVKVVFFIGLYGLMRGASWLARSASKAARKTTGTGADQRAWGRSFDPDHRALTHTGAAAVVAGVAAGAVFGLWVGVAVFLGWMSHLLSDACTCAGVPLLWPLPVRGRRWHPVGFLRRLRLKSCSVTDWYVACSVVALVAGPTGALHALIS